jgi:hypothetical protein
MVIDLGNLWRATTRSLLRVGDRSAKPVSALILSWTRPNKTKLLRPAQVLHPRTQRQSRRATPITRRRCSGVSSCETHARDADGTHCRTRPLLYSPVDGL